MRLENWIFTLPLKLRSFFRKRNLERELADELAFHLESQENEYRRRGEPSGEARYAARRTFGGLEQSKEQCRSVQPAAWLYQFGRDLAFGVRLLKKSPGFTLVAILTLALGIGANTAVFSLVHAILLRQLPFRDPGQVAFVEDSSTLARNLTVGSSRQVFYDTAASYHSLDSASVYSQAAANLSGERTEPQRVRVAEVSAQFFRVLGATPALGRVFSAHEDIPGKDHAVVITNRLWRQSLASDPAVIGRVLYLNSFSATIIAVMPPDVDFPSKPDVWVPTVFDWNDSLRENGAFTVNAIVRIRPVVSLAAAEREFQTRRQRARRETAAQNHAHVREGAILQPLSTQLTATIRPSLLLLTVAVVIVLCIVCANLASLMLIRALDRRAELAVRAALGATRARLIRQQVVECLLLAGVGGACGVLLARGFLRTLYVLRPAALRNFSQPALVWPVLAFTAAVSILTGFLFALAPGWLAGQRHNMDSLKTSSRQITARTAYLRRGLVVVEIALALVLLSGATLLIKTLANLDRVPLGFDSRNLLTFSVSLHGPAEKNTSSKKTFYDEAASGLSTIPGIENAAAISSAPLDKTPAMLLEVSSSNSNSQSIAALPRVVTTAYFRTMRVPIVAGRAFSENDVDTNQKVAIISQNLAAQLWPARNPLGRQIRCPICSKDGYRVVGVVPATRDFGPRAAEIYPQFFLPFHQMNWDRATFVVRTRGNPLDYAKAVRGILRSVSADQPVYDLETMHQLIADSESLARFETFTLSAFAAIATILAAVGLFGIISHTVVQRRQEIGIRLALGAPRSQIAGAILRETSLLTATGLALGTLASLLCNRSLDSVLFAVQTNDAATYCVVAALFTAIALLSTYQPVRRAASLDPMNILRAE
ncbi:MAG TPA: ABC transporter permease [Bryobacteraceae bacterium]|nr:ABC transporter permease [Bryobacteraceae bacterium]